MTHSTADEPTTEHDLSGQLLGDYQLLRLLGRGGMAEVYLAEQQSLHRRVAFKVLKHGLAKDESYVRRFHNEAQAAAALVQANIVQIYEVGRIDGVHFIAQEYVAGQNLRHFLARNGPLDAKLAVNIMRQVAAALHRAGQQGIIHRDIKPENIILAATGDVKVADFGLARVTKEDVSLTQAGTTLGTPLYMSPEQVEGKHVDPRSDLYSFGITAYHMLAGRPPYDGDTALSIALLHLNSEPQPLEKVRPDLPPGLCQIVHRLMAKQADGRFPTSAELIKALRALNIEGVEDQWPSGLDVLDAPVTLTPASARLEATQRLSRVMHTEALQRKRRKRVWQLAVVLVALAFLAGAGWAWLQRPAPLLPKDIELTIRIEPQQTVEEQYRRGYVYDSEPGWKAVAKYFPADSATDSGERLNRQYFARRADQRLAEFYLNNDAVDQAMTVFAKLANLEETELEFITYGLVGQAIVYARRNESDGVRQSLFAVDKLLADSTPQTRPAIGRGIFQLIDYADASLREKLEQLMRNVAPRQ